MDALRKVRTSIFVVFIAISMLIGGAQQSKASYYDNYLSYSQYFGGLYVSTGNPQYYFWSVGFYYYYTAGFYADYFGYYNDRVFFKSILYNGSNTNAANYYERYMAYGDYTLRR